MHSSHPGEDPPQCPRCRAENRRGVQYCEECGAAMPAACPRCGAPTVAGKRFCGGCGAPLGTHAGLPPAPTAPQGENRQVTVLFCDMVGSTGLAERIGAEAMHRLVGQFLDIAGEEVRRYGGTVSAFLGDGIMALVGVPQSHEDHARRAVLIAMALRRRLQGEWTALEMPGVERPQVRMGLNTGPVVVGGVRVGPQVQVSAIGDTMNVAARLQALAEPGQILVGPATAPLVEGYVRLESLGAVSLRGKGAPVEAYRVLGAGPRRSPLEGLSPRAMGHFVGRTAEMAALREALAGAREGRGQAVGVVGEPGMGKSRLLYEFRRGLAGERVTFLEGRCLSYGRAVPYLPVLDILRDNCGITPGDDRDVMAIRVGAALSEVGMDPQEHAPYLLHLLGAERSLEELAGLSPEAVRSGTFEALRQMAVRGGRRRTLLIAVEDLHWVDGPSEAFLVSLAETIAGASVMLLGTWRPGHRPSWMDLSYASQISVRPLREDDAMAVVRSVRRGDVPAGLSRAILARAEGNPFFLEELARATGEGSGTGDPVPATVQGVLMARLDRLPEEPRRLLQTGAVLGREFPVGLLAEVWEGPGEPEDHLPLLRQLEFVHERAGAAEPTVAFKHALTQEVAYGSLLTPRRRALHEAAGRALERLHADRLDDVVDRLAHHFSRAGAPVEAVGYLGRLAATSAARYAHAEAATALREALRHADSLPDAAQREHQTVDFTLGLVNSLYFLGALEESRDLLLGIEGRVARLGDDRRASEHLMWLGHTFSHLGEPSRAEAAARGAAAAAERCGDGAALGKALYVLTRECWWTGRFAEGVQHGRRADPLLESAGETWWQGHCRCYVAHCLFSSGRVGGAIEEAGRALAIGDAIGDRRIQSFATWSRGWYRAARGDAETGLDECLRSLLLSPDPVNSAWTLGFVGFAHMEAGDHVAAVDHLERALERMRTIKHLRVQCWFGGWLAEALLGAGRVDEARAAAEAAREVGMLVGLSWGVAAAERALGRVASVEGDDGRAVRHLVSAAGQYAAMGALFEEALTRLDLAAAEARAGAEDAGQGHAARALDLLAEADAPVYRRRAEQLARDLAAPGPAGLGG